MARTDNLTNYLTDVATAIKEKKGDMDTPISANTFDEEIRNLPSGGGDISEYISSTSDKTTTTNIYAGSQILYRIKKLPELDLTNIKTVSGLSNLFRSFSYITSLPLIKINETISQISLENICYECENLTDISNLINVIKDKKITIMNYAFYKCRNLEDFLFMSELDTSELTNLSNTFRECKKMVEIPFFDTSKVIDMSYCFYECSLLETIPEFNTAKCQNFSYIFGNANSLVSLPKLNFSSATNLINMLAGAKPNLTDLGGFESLGFSYNSKTKNYSQYTLDLSRCLNLTEQSLINVIDNLYDLNLAYEGDAVTQRLILGTDNMAKLTEEKIAEATAKGWNVS